MSAMSDMPIPAEVFADVPPITDDDLDRYFDAVDRIAESDSVDREVAEEWLSSGETADYPHATIVARWSIEDDGSAAWAAAKWSTAVDEVERLRAQADDWASRIELWFSQASRRSERTAVHMAALLCDYGLRRRESTGEATLSLPSASVRTTKHQASVEVVDDDLAAAWCELVPADVLEKMLEDDEVLVRHTAKVYVGPLRRLVRVEGDAAVGLDGEPVPGVIVRQASVTAKVNTR